MQVFISRDGERHGPYSIEDARGYLDAGQLLATDLAWQEGRADWVPLGELLGSAAAPPPSIAPPPVIPAGDGAGGVVGAAAPPAKGSKVKLVVRIVLGVVLLLVAVGVGLEHLAMGKFNAAYNIMDKELNSGRSDGVKELSRKLGREPASTSRDGHMVTQAYEWSGMFRVFRIRVVFAERIADEDVEIAEVVPQKRYRFGSFKE